MTLHCHRCGNAVDEEASFCPHCAAPELQVLPQQESAESDLGFARLSAHHRRAIDWRRLIRLALLMAIPVGLLALPFFPLVIAAPVLLISLYQRHSPRIPMDGRTGFRIGAFLGLLAAYVSAFGLAGWQIFERFSLHRGPALDAQYAFLVQQYTDTTQKMAQSNPVSAQQAKAMLSFLLSPDGRVTATFLDTAVLALGIVLFAGLGGMLGARLTRRSASQ
jgi:hypothetical protein